MTGPARSLRVVGEALYRDQAEALLRDAGDTALVARGQPRSLLIACPDGCGETLVINLDRRAGKAWRFDMRGGEPTLYPSVWRDGGCGSHFVVWRGRVMWCERFEDGNREPRYDHQLEPKVLAAMDEAEPRTAVALADAIDELVYDVDRVARRLASAGTARTWKRDGSTVFVRVDR